MISDKVVTLALELGMFVMVKNTNQNDKQVSETYEYINYSLGDIFLV